jgi:hypothetical protein
MWLATVGRPAPWGGFAAGKKAVFLLFFISIISIVLRRFGKCERTELCVMSYCREDNTAREVVYGPEIKSLFGLFLGLTRDCRRFMLKANFDGKGRLERTTV